MKSPLSLTMIDALLAQQRADIRHTPSVLVDGLAALSSAARISAKLELWQVTGSFKARGALAHARQLTPQQRQAGVTAVSAGNHAIATAFAAAQVGVPAKVVMTASAPALRRQRCEAYGAEVILAEDVHQAFSMVEQIEATEGRYFIHPFEGLITATGTAGVGREFMLDCTDLDAVIVPIGGGGLAAGVAAAVKLTNSRCRVFGVEPNGADSMTRSLAAGSAQRLDTVSTIADSLGAPMAMPESFALCQQYIDDVVTVSDDELKQAMRVIHAQLGLAVEPACAAALAALVGPLSTPLAGRHVGLIFCGSNIDSSRWQALIG